MLNVSNDFNEAYKNYEREIKMRIKINDVMYTDHDISSFSVDYGSFMGHSFGIGSTFTNSMKLTLCKIVEGLKQLDEVVPEMGIVMPDKIVEYVPLGVFVISEEVNIDRNDNKTVIECSDRMILMNEPYESKLQYPAPIRDVALEIANLSGMEVDKTSFSTIKLDVIDEPKNYTYREALGLIAQFMAGYMTFDRNGLLTIRYLVDKDYRITPKEYMLKGLEKNEILFRPAGIEVRTGQNEEDIMTVGKQKGSVIKLENTVMRRLLLDDMYTRIKDINFYPYTLKWRGNPAVEVGDWLRVTDTKGNVFKVPNLSYRLEYRGGLIATSTVETVASNEVKMGYRGVLDQTIHYVNNILEDGTGNHIYYGVEKPEYPKEGDTWFKKNGPDTEIYIYQKIAEPDVFDWVLQISSAVDDTIKEAIEELEKDVQNAKDKADEVAVSLVEVQKDADEAKASAEQSKVDAGNAVLDASKALVDAEKALSSANENKASISGLTVKVDEVTAELELKASKQDLNKLDGTVKNQQTQISQNATDIKTKASQSEVNTLKGTVTNQQTQITQNANEIKQKASQSLVDSINNKVTNQQAQINLNSENIKLKAEKSEVTNLKNEVDGLEIGSTNTLVGSDKIIVGGLDFEDGSRNEYQTLNVGKTFQNNFDFGDEVAISFDIEAPKGVRRLQLYNTNNKGRYKIGTSVITNIPKGKSRQFVITKLDERKDWNSPADWIEFFSNYGTSDWYKITKIKIEKGNKPTAWSPAPEDLATQGDVTKLEASINVEAGKITNLTSSVNKNTTEIGKLTIESNKISSQVVELQNQEISTQNFFPYSFVEPSFTINQNELTHSGTWAGPVVNNNNLRKMRLVGGEKYRIKYQFRLDEDPSSYIPYQQAQHGTLLLYSGVDHSKYPSIALGGTHNNVEDAKTWKKGTIVDREAVFVMPKDISPQTQYRIIGYTFRAMNKDGSFAKLLKGTFLNVTIQKGDVFTGWTPAPEDMATQSQITQLSNDILLRVEKGKVINQINVSTEGILIDGKKVHITGQTTIDNAVIKDAMIASMTANKLTAGTINANEIAVINVKADNIVSGTLNGIYINLDKTMTIATNGSIVSSYLYGEPYGETFNARWFDGTSRYGNRYMNFLSNVYDVNSNNTQGKFRHYTETFFGSDILKMRQYTNSSNTSTPISHLDVTANALFAGAGWNNDFVFDFPNGNMFLTGKITTYSLDSTWGLFTHGLTVAAGGGKALQTGRIDAPADYSTLLINSYRTDLAGLGLTKDRFYSEAIYNKTYSSGPQVCVTSAGTLGRVTSAAKYKLDIETPNNVIENAFKMLEIEPKMWFDKHEVETIAEAMSDGKLNDLEMEHQLRRHFGFIADDFHDKGLTEVVTYDEKGEIEGLQYDRISMYHNVILKRHQDEIEALKRQVAELIGGGKHE